MANQYGLNHLYVMLGSWCNWPEFIVWPFGLQYVKQGKVQKAARLRCDGVLDEDDGNCLLWPIAGGTGALGAGAGAWSQSAGLSFRAGFALRAG